MPQISLPSNISLVKDKKNPNKADLIVSPCHPGYGTTIGNSLRRVLLSSLPGAAVIAIKIEGADHEFAVVQNVKEDVIQILLNIKRLRLKIHTTDTVRLKIQASGEGEVKASDIQANADVEIGNPDLKIATLTSKDAKFSMEIIARQGRGYVPVEEREDEVKEIGLIAVDAVFTPIRSVGYTVDDVRVGQKTNFDKLTLTIETDGTIDPKDAVQQATQILMDHFELVKKLQGVPVEESVENVIPEVAEESVVEEIPAEEVRDEEVEESDEDNKEVEEE